MREPNLNHTGTDHFITIIPGCKLSWSDSTLRCIEKNVHTVITHDNSSVLKRLTIADSHAISADFPY